MNTPSPPITITLSRVGNHYVMNPNVYYMDRNHQQSLVWNYGSGISHVLQHTMNTPNRRDSDSSTDSDAGDDTESIKHIREDLAYAVTMLTNIQTVPQNSDYQAVGPLRKMPHDTRNILIKHVLHEMKNGEIWAMFLHAKTAHYPVHVELSPDGSGDYVIWVHMNGMRVNECRCVQWG
jgi:hypothetical protein